MEGQQNGLEKVQNPVILNLLKTKALIAGMGYTHISLWMIDNRKTYPGFIFRAAATAVGMFLCAIIFHVFSTAFGRITEDVIMQAGYGIGLILFLSVIGLMAAGTYQAGKHAFANWNEDKREAVKQIPLVVENDWQAPSILPDVILAPGRGELMADFAARVSAISPTKAEWFILIKPREMAVSVFTPTGGIHFERGQEPFLSDLKANELPPVGLDHQNETREYYEKYVTWFSLYWPRYSTRAKLEADPQSAHETAVEILKATAKGMAVTLYLLLLCLPLFGQSKTRQVDEALYQVRNQIDPIPPHGAKVQYEFLKGNRSDYINRIGNGKDNYTTLLQKGGTGIIGFRDEGGDLQRISLDGEPLINRNPQPKPELVNAAPTEPVIGPNGAPYLEPSTTGDPVRRRTLRGPDVANTPVTDRPLSLHIPTPEETTAALENASREWDYRKTELWGAVKPIWAWVMGIFFSIIPLFICLGGMFRYYASTAADEGFYGISWVGGFIRRVHEAASGFTLLICWGIATVLLIDEFMLFIYHGIPLWWMLILWFPSLYVAKLLTNYFVPNPPGSRRALAARRSGGNFPTPYEV